MPFLPDPRITARCSGWPASGSGLFQGYALGAPAPLEHWLGTDQEEASSRSIV
jgi:hypothetical protein